MLSFSSLSLTFGERQIFNNLSFCITEGEKVGLVGDNGAGKTTLLRIIAGEIQSDRGRISIPAESICYVPQYLPIERYDLKTNVLSFMLEGKGLSKISSRLKEIEAMIDTGKNVDSESLIAEYLALNEEFIQLEGYRAESDVSYILSGLKLNADPSQMIMTLSGGQKTKMALGRMLFERSNILLLDEPTNHIDDDAIDWLAGYLSKSPQTILVVSHLPSFLDKVVKRILFIDDSATGIRSYSGNYSHFLKIRRNEIVSKQRTKSHVEAEIKRQTNIVTNATQSQVGMKHDREKIVARLEEQHKGMKEKTKKLEFSLPVRTPLRKFTLGVENLAKSYGTILVFSGISFTLAPHERLAILGENGAGKTTLLRIMAGQEMPNKGLVSRNQKLEIGWYRQEQEDLDDSRTILEECQDDWSGPIQKLRSALAHFLFPADRLSQIVGTLSRGERTRLSLCKIMLKGPNLLLLDEPTNHLDQLSQKSLMEALNDYVGGIIVVSHDIDFIKKINITTGIQMPAGQMVRVQ